MAKRERLWKTIGGAIALAVALVLLASLAFDRFVARKGTPSPELAEPSPVPTSTSTAAVPAELGAMVRNVVGTVERSIGSTWTAVHQGDSLRVDDSIRTGAFSSAELQVGEGSQLTVTDASELVVRELTEAVHRFRLSRGRIAVDYANSGERVLKIENETTGAVAETRGAKFHVLATGVSLAVATETGVVDLKAAEGTVRVGEGQQSVVHAGSPPSAAEPIPVELLLKLARAGQEQAQLCVKVEGSVRPGCEVRIDGKVVTADAQGRFAVAVDRRKGLKAVKVETRDALGRSREQRVPCGGVKRKPGDDPAITGIRIRWDDEER